jgi:hypothetical protein
LVSGPVAVAVGVGVEVGVGVGVGVPLLFTTAKLMERAAPAVPFPPLRL